jgi:transposase
VSENDKPRLREAERRQITLQAMDFDALVALEHPVRGLWAMVEALNLSEFYATIEARGSKPGAPATDPKILLALWLFANVEGIGSARLLAKLCERDAPYRWICGGVSVNYHGLADFRVAHGKKLDKLLTQVIAALMKRGVVKLNRVAHDGMKVRASAGASSFRRRQSLDRCYEEAKEQVRKLKRELEEDAGASSRREQAARERAASERQASIEAALETLAELEEKQAAPDRQSPSVVKRRREARASTTDAECRVMKMPDGGFRPAYNAQFATDESGVIVGADVTNEGTDYAQLKPMLDQIEERTGTVPSEYLVDGGYVKHENIEAISERGATPYAPVPRPKDKAVDPYEPKRGDSAAVAAWRVRMKGEDGKRVYMKRAALAERTNADLRGHRKLDRLNVRGLAKVKAVVLLGALAFNLMKALTVGIAL